jgi:hypothetical protein
MDFAGVVTALSAEVRELLTQSGKIDGLEFVGIDLALRDARSTKKKKRNAKVKKAAAAPRGPTLRRSGKTKGEARAPKRSRRSAKSKRHR